MTSDPTSATTFSPDQVSILESRAIDVETAWLAGVTSVQEESDLPSEAPAYWTVAAGYLPGLLFRYRSPDGAVELQLRPDVPVVSEGENGKKVTRKYVFAKGARSVLHCARPDVDARNVLIVEGTCQAIAAAEYAPAGWAVYGIAGCQSWMQDGVGVPDLSVVDGRRVFVILDADAATNRNVYDAGRKLGAALRMQSAEEVRFVRVPAGGKAGLDDVLAGSAPERRGRLMEGLIRTTAELKPSEKPEEPARRRPEAKKGGGDHEGADSPWFDADGALKVQELAGAIRDDHHALLTRDDGVAVYRDGAYVMDKHAIGGAITDRLGDAYTTGRHANVEAFLVHELARLGEKLPEYVDRPLVNFTNGMLDLETLEMLEHSPAYRSTHQLTVAWDPEAVCPLFDAWAASVAGSQVDALLEAASAVLDPSVAASKALFLFGPARSGKSTFLGLLEALIGQDFVAGVSLHQLSDDRFAAANLYGKVLNLDADVKAADVRDLSLFKKLTGQDTITANRKFGKQFEFRNRALFAFSANELPAVGENSRAWVARIVPILFGLSVEGHEDVTLGPRLRAELPGIARRLVEAWAGRRERGETIGPDPRVVELFERASDRVRQWVDDRCEVTGGYGSTLTELYTAFRRWAADNGAHELGKRAFAGRLAGVPGAYEVQQGGNQGGRRGWNLRLRPENDWTEGNVQQVYEEVMGSLTGGKSGSSGLLARTTDSHVIQTRRDDIMDKKEEYLPLPMAKEWVETAASAASPESVILKGIQALCPSEPPPCPRCGTTQVLVDGHWFACPTCHPATARVEK